MAKAKELKIGDRIAPRGTTLTVTGVTASNPACCDLVHVDVADPTGHTTTWGIAPSTDVTVLDRAPKFGPHMTAEDVQNRVTRIRSIQYDDEGAHSSEDHLYVDVLTAIADGSTNPAALAAEALRSQDIDFARRCI